MFTTADNADGTGLTATIAGGLVGDAHSLAAYSFSGAVGNLSLAATGTRSGNGTIALALAVGTYLFVLTTNGAVTAAPQFASATSGDPSYQEEIQLLVLAKIQSLPLTGLLAAEMTNGKQPLPETLTDDKGVLVSTLAEVIERKYNSHDDVGYGVLITCFIKNSQNNNTANLGSHLSWREIIRRAFNQTPTNVPIVHPRLVSLTIEPAAPWIFNPEAFLKHHLDAASLVLRVKLRELR